MKFMDFVSYWTDGLNYTNHVPFQNGGWKIIENLKQPLLLFRILPKLSNIVSMLDTQTVNLILLYMLQF